MPSRLKISSVLHSRCRDDAPFIHGVVFIQQQGLDAVRAGQVALPMPPTMTIG
jgi:hypothetical protein